MPTRAIVLTAAVAACVSSAVTLALALLVLPRPIHAAPDQQSVQDVVRTKQLIIVDSQGNTRVDLRTAGQPVDERAEGIASIELLDRDGRGLVSLSAQSSTGSTIGMADAQGNGRLVLRSWGGAPGDPDNSNIGLEVSDRQGVPRIFAGVETPLGIHALLRSPYEYTAYIDDEHRQPIWQAP